MGGIVFFGLCMLLIGTNLGTVQGVECDNKGRCQLKKNADNARVIHPSTTYTTYSCTPCLAKGKEVHVVGVYEGFGPWAGSLKLHLTKDSSASPVPTTLVLLSYETVIWQISADAGIQLQKIHVLSYNGGSSSVQLGQGISSQPEVTVENRYLGYGADKRLGQLLDFVSGSYGNLTSLTSVYSVDSDDMWTLNLHVTDSCDDFQDYKPGECYLKHDLQNARLQHPDFSSHIGSDLYSCSTCRSEGTEVHAVSIVQGSWDKEGLPDLVTYGEIKLNALISDPAPIILVLMSVRPVYWNITEHGGIHIAEILLVSNSAEKSDVLLDQDPMPLITRVKNSVWPSDCVDHFTPVDFVIQRFGFITSYTGGFSLYSTEPATLTTGVSPSCSSGSPDQHTQALGPNTQSTHIGIYSTQAPGPSTQPTDIGIYRTGYGKTSKMSVIVRMNMFK